MQEVNKNFDPLTGLHDRSILSSLNESFAQREYPWSLIIIDIDHFKLVNDIYGHLVGDEVLSHVGHTLRVNLKNKDFPLRYGGDEFLAILPNTNGNGALALAQRLLFELENRELPVGLKISASLGITQSTSLDKDLSDLIAKADQALYYAKETGRGRFVLANDLEIRQGIEPDFSQMVGRREELQYLQELLDNSIKKSTNICLLTGTKGTGKTKLVDEFMNYCQFKKAPVFKTEILQAKEESNFLILSIIKKALNTLSKKQLSTAIKAVGPIEQITIEQLSDFPFMTVNRTVLASEFDIEARNRKNLATILKEISRIHPFVIVLENLHVASNPSIEFSLSVINTATKANFLCIAISDKPDILKSLDAVFKNIHLNRLHLFPLNQIDIKTMIFFALKSPGISENVIDYMVQQSGGNALFLREIINWCISEEFLNPEKGDICLWQKPAEHLLPESLNSIIEVMLWDYSITEITVLKKAAIAGNMFTLELLSELTAKEQLFLAEILDKFIELGLIKDNENYFSFSYGVMRSHLIARITPSIRKLLHGKTADFLVNQIPDSKDIDSLTSTIAFHFCNSANIEEAAKYSRKAAQITFSKGLHSEAIQWYQEFLKLNVKETNLQEEFKTHLNIGILYSITGNSALGESHMFTALELTDNPIDLCGVYYRLGDNYQRRSMYSKAIEFYNKTLTNGYSIKSRSKVLISNMIAALLGLSFIYRIQSRMQEAKQQLLQAKKLLDDEKGNYEKVIEGMYYTRLADIKAETGSEQKALELYTKGLDICVQGKDPTGEAIILNNMHSLYATKGDYDSMLNSLKQVIKLNTKLNDQLGLAIGYYNLAETYTQLNMLDLARRYFQMYIELNGRIQNQLGMAYGEQGLGNLAILNGNSQKAIEYFTNSSKIFEELNCTEMKLEADLNLAKALISAGNYQACKHILEKASSNNANTRYQNTLLHLKGVLLYSSEKTDELLKKSVLMIKQSIFNSATLQADEIVYMYSNLFYAMQSANNTEEGISILDKAQKLLNIQLSVITSESIKNSILSRSDIISFLHLCKQEGLTVPLLEELSIMPEAKPGRIL